MCRGSKYVIVSGTSNDMTRVCGLSKGASVARAVSYSCARVPLRGKLCLMEVGRHARGVLIEWGLNTPVGREEL